MFVANVAKKYTFYYLLINKCKIIITIETKGGFCIFLFQLLYFVWKNA